MKLSTKKILVIADAIAQLKSARFQAASGNYVNYGARYKVLHTHPKASGDQLPSSEIQKAVKALPHCGVCAKGSLLMTYVDRFNSIDGRMFDNACEMNGIENNTPLGELFGVRLLAELEFLFEGRHYTGQLVTFTEEEQTKLLLARHELAQNLLIAGAIYYANNEERNRYLITLLELLLDNDGEKLIL